MKVLNSKDRKQRKTLLAVLGLNAGLSAALGAGGLMADSSALLANASDAAVYLISFLDVGRAPFWKRRAARTSGVLLLAFAVGVLADAVRRWWFGTEPIGWTMMALVAAVVNLLCFGASAGAKQRCQYACRRDLQRQ